MPAKKEKLSKEDENLFLVSAKELYNFEIDHRQEINQNLMHVLQLGIAEIAAIIYFSLQKFAFQLDIFLNVMIWISFISCVLSVSMAAFGILYYKTAHLNSAKQLEDYSKELDGFYKVDSAVHFSEFLKARWIENAHKNWERNRLKSKWNFSARIALVVSAIPLVVFVGRVVYEMFPLF